MVGGERGESVCLVGGGGDEGEGFFLTTLRRTFRRTTLLPFFLVLVLVLALALVLVFLFEREVGGDQDVSDRVS